MTIHLTSRRIALVAAGGLLAALSFGGGAQAVTDTIFRYSAPKVGALMLSPADFVEHSSASTFDRSELGITTTSVAQVCFYAPVHLPQGATITQLRAYYKRPTVTDVIFIYLRRVNAMASLIPVVANEAQTQAPVTASGTVTYAAVASVNVVNNVLYSYRVALCIANDGQLMHARVDYTYTNAGD